jgi:hypothetical protein
MKKSEIRNLLTRLAESRPLQQARRVRRKASVEGWIAREKILEQLKLVDYNKFVEESSKIKRRAHWTGPRFPPAAV